MDHYLRDGSYGVKEPHLVVITIDNSGLSISDGGVVTLAPGGAAKVALADALQLLQFNELTYYKKKYEVVILAMAKSDVEKDYANQLMPYNYEFNGSVIPFYFINPDDVRGESNGLKLNYSLARKFNSEYLWFAQQHNLDPDFVNLPGSGELESFGLYNSLVAHKVKEVAALNGFLAGQATVMSHDTHHALVALRLREMDFPAATSLFIHSATFDSEYLSQRQETLKAKGIDAQQDVQRLKEYLKWLSYFDKVVVHTPRWKKAVESSASHFGISPPRVSWAPAAIELPDPGQEPDATVSERMAAFHRQLNDRFGEKPTIFGMFCRVDDPYKNPLYGIQAFYETASLGKLQAPAVLVVAGDATRTSIKSYRAYIENLELHIKKLNVILPPGFAIIRENGETKNFEAMMRMCDCFVHLADRDGLNLTVLEGTRRNPRALHIVSDTTGVGDLLARQELPNNVRLTHPPGIARITKEGPIFSKVDTTYKHTVAELLVRAQLELEVDSLRTFDQLPELSTPSLHASALFPQSSTLTRTPAQSPIGRDR